jgi:pyroglutamyl-peptidase
MDVAVFAVDWMWLLMRMLFVQVLSSIESSMSSSPRKSHRVLLTGFGPFAGRTINASSIGTTSVAASRHDVKRVIAEVVWGEPTRTVLPLLDGDSNVVISFGEATDTFRLELVARNERGARRRDNAGALPSVSHIRHDGPDVLKPVFDADRVVNALAERGFPIECSTNAGQFLCDEMFYTLLHEQRFGKLAASLDVVAFVHVPIFGHTTKLFDGASGALVDAPFDEKLAERFCNAVVDVFIAEANHIAEREARHKRPSSNGATTVPSQ